MRSLIASIQARASAGQLTLCPRLAILLNRCPNPARTGQLGPISRQTLLTALGGSRQPHHVLVRQLQDGTADLVA